MKTPKAKKTPVRNNSDIPTSFASENEERDWWAQHELTDDFFAEAGRDAWTHVANLEFQVMKLLGGLEVLTEETRSLKDRIDKLESQLSSSGS